MKGAPPLHSLAVLVWCENWADGSPRTHPAGRGPQWWTWQHGAHPPHSGRRSRRASQQLLEQKISIFGGGTLIILWINRSWLESVTWFLLWLIFLQESKISSRTVWCQSVQRWQCWLELVISFHSDRNTLILHKSRKINFIFRFFFEWVEILLRAQFLPISPSNNHLIY